MKQEENSGKRVDEILESLNGITRASANPHLYTRILGRLQEDRSAWAGIASFLSRPMVAFSLVLMLVAANAWIILQNRSSLPEDKTEQLTALAQEYRFEKTTMLDQNSTLP